MQSSVSSHPSGISPIRPISSSKVPTSSNTVRAHRHVAAPQVAHVGPLGGLPLVGAAHDPVQLGRQVVGPTVRPHRLRDAADRHHPRVVVRREQLLDPVRLGPRVVVEEGDDRRPWPAAMPVLRAPEAPPVREVLQHPDRRELVAGARQQLGVVVDDQDRLQRRHGLVRRARPCRRRCRPSGPSCGRRRRRETSSGAGPLTAVSPGRAAGQRAGAARNRGHVHSAQSVPRR